jgi:hypothetical protein
MPLWTNAYSSVGYYADEALGLAGDRAGSVIVTGNTTSNGNKWDFGTVKYSSGGIPLWTNIFGGDSSFGNDRVTAVAVDGNENVYVTGKCADAASGLHCALVKYSSAGVALWTNRFNGQEVKALVVDGSGNVVITGSTFTNYANDCLTIKYSEAGVALWTNLFSLLPNSYDIGIGLAVDGAENIYLLAGSSADGKSQFATIKYSGGGVATNNSVALSVDRAGGTFSNAMILMTGRLNTYHLAEFATNLTTSPWLPLSTNNSGLSGTWRVIDSAATNSQRFYRVRPFCRCQE